MHAFDYALHRDPVVLGTCGSFAAQLTWQCLATFAPNADGITHGLDMHGQVTLASLGFGSRSYSSFIPSDSHHTLISQQQP